MSIDPQKKNYETAGELPAGIAPERHDGTYDPDWKPGDPDPNIDRVRELSDPEHMGIQPKPVMVDIGGIWVSRDQAIELGYIEP